MNTDHDIEVTLTAIAEETDDCQYNHRAIRRYKGGKVRVGLQTQLEVDAAHGVLGLTVSTVYTDCSGMFETKMLRHVVRAEFTIINLSDAVEISEVALRLPHHLLTMMLGTTIGAQRGMMALRLADTPLSAHPLPLLNVAALAESLTTAPADSDIA